MAEPSYPQPVIIRSKLVLEAASEMVAVRGWSANFADIELRTARDGDPVYTIASRTGQSQFEQVADGSLHVAIANPSSALTLAVRGVTPLARPLPLRVLTVLPSADQLVFAVRGEQHLHNIEEIAERRLPLSISVRADKDHSLHLVTAQIFAACGFSYADLIAWGGEIRYDAGMPIAPNRLGAAMAGQVDAVLDEGADRWVGPAAESGMNILGLREETLRRLIANGLRPGVLSRAQFPELPEDVATIDFSGWPVFVHADAPEEFIVAFCKALEARRDRIPWQGAGPLPLDQMCVDSPSTPFDVPLHDAAKAFWHDRGYL